MTGTATVSEQVGGDSGRVRYGGADWAARSVGAAIAPGTKVVVVGLADEDVLLVFPEEAARQATKVARDAPLTFVSWREASAARGTLNGGYLLSPDERVRLLYISQARRRYADRIYWPAFFSFVSVFCAAIFIAILLSMGPVLRAARGQGSRGVFTATTLSCDKTCSWEGTFTFRNGTILPHVTYADSLPASVSLGSTVPALFPGGSNTVYAVRGSTSWLYLLWLLPLVAGGLAVTVWLGPAKYVRLHREARRAPLPPAT
jgi:hypothetical protein